LYGDLFRNKRAESVSKLILVVVLILVASIAVSVIFSVNYNLDNKAVRVADRAQDYAAIAMNVVQIYAEDGRNENTVYDFSVKMKLSPKSQPIRLSQLLIGFDSHNETVQYTLREVNYSNDETHNCTWNNDVTASGYSINASPGNITGTYGVEYVLKGPKFIEGYFQSGDFIKLCFRTPRSIETDEEITVHFVPKLSAAFNMKLHSPNLFNSKKIYLYPSRTTG
jgi:archaellin